MKIFTCNFIKQSEIKRDVLPVVSKPSDPPVGGASNGFTLIELLVSITIVVVLAAIGMISYTSVTMSSRDTKRKQDLKVIQQALEQYYTNSGNKYPTLAQFTAANFISSYLPNGIPVDPKGCIYRRTLSTTAYSICADLETVGTGSCTTNNDYCVSQLQR